MCWWCGNIRPSDGPEDLAPRGEFNTEYRIGDLVYVANEDAPWEHLNTFPQFQSEFFQTRSAEKGDETLQEKRNANPVTYQRIPCRCCNKLQQNENAICNTCIKDGWS